MIQDDAQKKPKPDQPVRPAHRPAIFTGGPVNFEAATTPIIDELGLQSARESTIETRVVKKSDAEETAAPIPADDKATVDLVSPEPIAVPPVTWSWGCTLEPSATLIAYYASLPSHMPGRRLRVITLD